MIGAIVDEHTDTDEQETPAPNPRTALLIGLGGLAAIAVILLAVRMAKPRGTVSDITDVPMDGNWQASVQHLADAVGERMGNLETRVDALASDRVRAAATSEPPVPLVVDPIAQNGAAQAAHVSDATADVPTPAAVSLPDA